MKQPAGTVPPVVGEPNPKRTFADLFRPQHRRDKYYEARSRRGDLYCLWMECVRFGMRMAYPCVLSEEDGAPRVYGSGSDTEAEENSALIRRWQELDIADMAPSLEITELDEDTFRKKYKEYL